MRRFHGVMAFILVFGLFLSGTALAKDVTLEVWFSDFNSNTQKFVHEHLVPSFETANPDIKVKVSFISWSVFYDKLYTSFAAGTAPDLYQGGSTFRGPAATQFLGMPIDQYTKDWPDKKDFFPGSWAAVSWEGHDYGIPSLTAPRSIVYRSDLLAEGGFDPEDPPTLWDHVLKAAKKLTKVDGTGHVLRWGFNVPNASWGFWLPLLWQAGGDLTTPDGGKPLYNTPEGIEAADFYLNFYKEQSAVGKLPTGGFATGAYVMEYTNTKAVADTVLRNPNLAGDLRVGPPMKYKQQATAIYTDSFFMSAQTKNPDEAWEFLKWFAKTENITEYNRTLSYMPPRRSAMKSGYVNSSPHIKDAIEKVMPYGVVNPAHHASSSTPLQNAFKKLFNGEWTPQAALQNAAAGWVPLKK